VTTDVVEAALLDVERSVSRLMDSEPARQTALHEAAHVVAAWAMGGAVERVTIVPSPTSLGLTVLARRLPPTEMAAFALIGSFVAGSSTTDDQMAMGLVGEAGIAAALARARAIAEEHCAAIEAVAAALVARRTLSRADLEVLRLELFPPADPRARVEGALQRYAARNRTVANR